MRACVCWGILSAAETFLTVSSIHVSNFATQGIFLALINATESSELQQSDFLTREFKVGLPVNSILPVNLFRCHTLLFLGTSTLAKNRNNCIGDHARIVFHYFFWPWSCAVVSCVLFA